MAKIKTSSLVGPALDWAVAQCSGETYPNTVVVVEGDGWEEPYRPSTNWAQGGPIIEREEIDIAFDVPSEGMWRYAQMGVHKGQGSTPLIAAMRCYVASKLGDEVDIPGDEDSTYSPTTDWSQGGPIIERECITIQYWKTGTSGYWSAFASITSNSDYPIPSYEGETMLIAAMRCYVASKLGDEVDIPEELS